MDSLVGSYHGPAMIVLDIMWDPITRKYEFELSVNGTPEQHPHFDHLYPTVKTLPFVYNMRKLLDHINTYKFEGNFDNVDNVEGYTAEFVDETIL